MQASRSDDLPLSSSRATIPCVPMSVKSNRIVVVAVAFTLVATFYSLSELHRLSTLHASGDTAKFVTHDGSQTQITIVKGGCDQEMHALIDHCLNIISRPQL